MRRALLSLLAIGVAGFAASASAAPSCSGASLIDQTFANGARWQLCWATDPLEAVNYHEIHYTPPGGSEIFVLYEINLAQVHVPYDDDGARYHDVTDYALGGVNLNDLTPADCPGGTLLAESGKDAVCRTLRSEGSGIDGVGNYADGQVLEVFSVSHVGEYNYIPLFRFHDDGAIEVRMGATGALERFIYNDPGATDLGWPLDAAGNVIGVAHLHNYFFRLDFDMAGTPDDDIVEEIESVADAQANTRVLDVTPFTVEAAADVAPDRLRSWRIRDATVTNADGRPISWELMPLDTGHRDVGPAYEPFTHHDFWVTRYSDCERYASHNNQVLGCGDDLPSFVSGESLVGQDLVVWYGFSFHHIPRDEDETRMHAHWNGFRLEPRDVMIETPYAWLLAPAPGVAPAALVTALAAAAALRMRKRRA